MKTFRVTYKFAGRSYVARVTALNADAARALFKMHHPSRVIVGVRAA